MRSGYAALLELYAASESLKKAHDLLVKDHPTLAVVAFGIAKLTLKAIGKLVTAESAHKKAKVTA